MIKNLWLKVPVLWRIPALIFICLVAFVLVSYVWAGAWNGVGNWWYHHSENSARQEIRDITQQKNEEIKIANQAVAVYEASKQIIEEEKKKREAAEKFLADKTKNTDEKLAAYENAVKGVPTHTLPESDRELCERAKSLGIVVQCY